MVDTSGLRMYVDQQVLCLLKVTASAFGVEVEYNPAGMERVARLACWLSRA
jgi:hypothetical protein